MPHSLYQLVCKWIVALEAGRFENLEWIRWADSVLSTNLEPFPWLVDLCVAKTKESALQAFRLGHASEPSLQQTSFDQYGAEIGFAYKNWMDSRIGYPEFVNIVLDVLAQLDEDTAEHAQLLDFAINSSAPTEDLRLTQRMEKLIQPYVCIADECLADLGSELPKC